jgi:hypothetical protein
MSDKSDWLKWLVGIIWGIILLWLTSLTSNIICVDKDSRNRDALEASQRENINRETVRLDTNQKAVMEKMKEVSTKMDCMQAQITTIQVNQGIIIDNQKMFQEGIAKSISKLEDKIDRIK